LASASASASEYGLSLRGGEAGTEEDGEDVEEQDSDKASASSRTGVDDKKDGQLVLRGGTLGGQLVSNVFKELHRAEGDEQYPSRWSATDTFSATLHTPFSGDKAVPERWLPLYGYQGVVWFRADSFYTFVDAVDRLLCLDNRAGLTYSLYLMDKDKQYTTKTEREAFRKDTKNNGLSIWCSGVGDYSHDHLAWKWVLDRVNDLQEGEEQAYRQVLFIAGPDDPVPWTWEPGPSAGVLKIALDWVDVPKMNRPDVAYLRMPQNPRKVIYSNQYGPWMAHVCRVLAAGRIPGRPGLPTVPDAVFTIKGQDPREDDFHSYGGLYFLPLLWDAIISEWERDKAGMVTLEARTGRGHKEDSHQWQFFRLDLMFGYGWTSIRHNDVDNIDKVYKTIELVTAAGRDKIESVEFYLPGPGFLSEDPPSVVIPTIGHGDELKPAFQPIVDLMTHYRQWLKKLPGVAPVANGLGLFPQFITVRSIFDKYTITGVDKDTETYDWDPNTCSIAFFRTLVEDVLFSRAFKKQPFELPQRYWIGITQCHRRRPVARNMGSMGTLPHFSEGMPKLLVGPDITENEWRLICRLIVGPKIFVSRVHEGDLPSKEKKSASAASMPAC
jgi:hypothetical protein